MKYLKNIASIKIDSKKCNGCKTCLHVCPHEVISYTNKKAHVTNKDACMECGACQLNCPTNAITVESGVGCAYAIFKGMITGSEPSCDCGGGPKVDGGCC